MDTEANDGWSDDDVECGEPITQFSVEVIKFDNHDGWTWRVALNHEDEQSGEEPTPQRAWEEAIGFLGVLTDIVH